MYKLVLKITYSYDLKTKHTNGGCEYVATRSRHSILFTSSTRLDLVLFFTVSGVKVSYLNNSIKDKNKKEKIMKTIYLCINEKEEH